MNERKDKDYFEWIGDEICTIDSELSEGKLTTPAERIKKLAIRLDNIRLGRSMKELRKERS